MSGKLKVTPMFIDTKKLSEESFFVILCFVEPASCQHSPFYCINYWRSCKLRFERAGVYLVDKRLYLGG